MVCSSALDAPEPRILPMLVLSIHTPGMRCNIYGDADGRSVSLPDTRAPSGSLPPGWEGQQESAPLG
ncbi:hypothetical protein KC338_g273 [Hortaea werneckii]|nr:hypothetical protein KC338_g273 [Hortaea werneckii]